jgi:hypothetical protein
LKIRRPGNVSCVFARDVEAIAATASATTSATTSRAASTTRAARASTSAATTTRAASAATGLLIGVRPSTAAAAVSAAWVDLRFSHIFIGRPTASRRLLRLRRCL